MFPILLMCIVAVFILLSNIMCVVFLTLMVLDPYITLQGVDYCICSLTISDLLNGILVAPMSIIAFYYDRTWIFGQFWCHITAYLSYTLFAVNGNTIFWLAVDRHLYITEVKYKSFKMRIRARCICKLIFAWIIPAMFCMPPLLINRKAVYMDVSSVCRFDWVNLKAYFLTIICIMFIPVFLGTIYTFSRIFILRFKYKHGYYRKIKAATVENLMESTHKMSFAIMLVFWLSWFPYIGYVLHYEIYGEYLPPIWTVWVAYAQAIWKIAIIMSFDARYQVYLKEIIKFLNIRKTTTDEFGCLQEDIEMHM